jgi:hypothetical protein
LKCGQIVLELHVILNLLLQQLVSDTIFAIFFTFFGVNKTNELAVTSNKLTNNFEGLVTSGLWPDVACGQPV